MRHREASGRWWLRRARADAPRLVVLVVAVAVLPWLAGCGPGGSSSGAGGAEPGALPANARAGFAVPGPPPPPPRPSPPAKPWEVAPVLTITTAASPSPAPRPSTIRLAASLPTPLTTPTVIALTQVCLPLYGAGVSVPVQVSTKTGAAVMSWWHNGDHGAIAYWVGVQALAGTPAARSAIRWTHLSPPTGCHDIVFTVPGLARRVPYRLWLDLESRTPERASGVTRHTLNQVPALLP